MIDMQSTDLDYLIQVGKWSHTVSCNVFSSDGDVKSNLLCCI
jgi:hypothetical protein